MSSAPSARSATPRPRRPRTTAGACSPPEARSVDRPASRSLPKISRTTSKRLPACVHTASATSLTRPSPTAPSASTSPPASIPNSTQFTRASRPAESSSPRGSPTAGQQDDTVDGARHQRRSRTTGSPPACRWAAPGGEASAHAVGQEGSVPRTGHHCPLGTP